MDESANAHVELPAILQVLNPTMWPWFSGRGHRRLNRGATASSVARSDYSDAGSARRGDDGAADRGTFMGNLPVQRWVYYCVDDFAQWPGLDQHTLRQMEQRVVHDADVVIAASETLQTRLAEMGR